MEISLITCYPQSPHQCKVCHRRLFYLFLIVILTSIYGRQTRLSDRQLTPHRVPLVLPTTAGANWVAEENERHAILEDTFSTRLHGGAEQSR